MAEYTQVTTQILNDTIDSAINRWVKNGYSIDILPFHVVAWQDNGTVLQAYTGLSSLADFAGVSVMTISGWSFGKVAKAGNIPGALVGMGATPGQVVYMGVVAGELSLTPPSDYSSTIFKVGRAEPANYSTDGAAIDLFLEPEIISEG